MENDPRTSKIGHFQGQTWTFWTALILTFLMIIGIPGPNDVGQSEIGHGEQHSWGLGYPYLAQISVFHKSTKICPN